MFLIQLQQLIIRFFLWETINDLKLFISILFPEGNSLSNFAMTIMSLFQFVCTAFFKAFRIMILDKELLALLQALAGLIYLTFKVLDFIFRLVNYLVYAIRLDLPLHSRHTNYINVAHTDRHPKEII